LVNVEVVTLGLASIIAFISITWFWRLFANPVNLVSLLSVGAISLIAILNTGFIMAWSASVIGVQREFQETLNIVHVSIASYSIAVFYASAFSAILALYGMTPFIRVLEKNLTTRLLSIGVISGGVLLLSIGVCLAIDLLAFKSGVLRFREIVTDGAQQGRLAWFVPILESVFGMQIFLNSVLLERGSRRCAVNWILLIFGIASMGAVLFVYFNKGRGPFVMALALHFFYWCFLRGGRPSMKWMIFLAIGACVAIPPVLAANNYLRSNTTNLENIGVNNNPFEFAAAGFERLHNARVASMERASSMENLSTRPLVANPLAKCITMPIEVKTFMYGKNIVNSFIWAVPRLLYHNKIRYSAMEGLLYRYFPDISFLKDTPDSLYLYSYTDFGWAGLVIYPLIVAGLWAIALLMMLCIRNPFSLWLIFSAWPPMFLLNIGESSATAWFLTERNTLMLLIVLLGIELMTPMLRKRWAVIQQARKLVHRVS
jgi:hypothetical protein